MGKHLPLDNNNLTILQDIRYLQHSTKEAVKLLKLIFYINQILASLTCYARVER